MKFERVLECLYLKERLSLLSLFIFFVPQLYSHVIFLSRHCFLLSLFWFLCEVYQYEVFCVLNYASFIFCSNMVKHHNHEQCKKVDSLWATVSYELAIIAYSSKVLLFFEICCTHELAMLVALLD